jgi:hypothetical protein
VEFVALALISLVTGFLGGVLGSLLLSRVSVDFPHRQPAVGETVKKQGPFIYTTETKRKPKAKSEREIWEMENGQKV